MASSKFHVCTSATTTTILPLFKVYFLMSSASLMQRHTASCYSWFYLAHWWGGGKKGAVQV